MVATVHGHVILLSQIERAARESLWLRGKTLDELTPEERHAERLATLDELIDHQLLRVKTKDSAASVPVSESEIDEALKHLAARFPNPAEMQAQLAAEGIDSDKELRLRLGARLQQQKFIESRIAPQIAVSEAEARAWHAAHEKELAKPERVRARQIFIATLGADASATKETLQKALDELIAKKQDFAALAVSLSGDARSKAAGGDLGWMTKDRLPADFAGPLFSLPVNHPELLRTKLGWHLVEVTDRKPAEPRTYEEAQSEVVAALQSMKRCEAVAALRKSLREQDAASIRVFSDMIPE